MVPLLKRHEIQVLLRAGFAPRDVAERSGTSVDTVRRVAREADVTDTSDGAARRERRIGRPSKAAPFAEPVRKWLAEAPELPTQELLRRAKLREAARVLRRDGDAVAIGQALFAASPDPDLAFAIACSCVRAGEGRAPPRCWWRRSRWGSLELARTTRFSERPC